MCISKRFDLQKSCWHFKLMKLSARKSNPIKRYLIKHYIPETGILQICSTKITPAKGYRLKKSIPKITFKKIHPAQSTI